MEPQHNEQKKLPDKTNTQQILKTNKRKLWTPVQLRGPAAEAAAFKPDFAWNRKAHSHDAVTP